MQYLTWRVMAGLNQRIEISFMLVGHTKFAPDWCFGLLKQLFRRTKVGCLADIVKVVNDSSTVNSAQLVGKEDGTVIVPQYNWADHFATFFRKNAFAGIKSLHHLVFSADRPGEAQVRESTDGTVKTLSLLATKYKNWRPQPHEMPQEITPDGLSMDRKKYLFEKIREFCPPHCRDIVCPDPHATTPAPCTTYLSALPDLGPILEDRDTTAPPSPKRRYHEA
jgi:hypothetical protein